MIWTIIAPTLDFYPVIPAKAGIQNKDSKQADTGGLYVHTKLARNPVI